jgi:hypothetical protein
MSYGFDIPESGSFDAHSYRTTRGPESIFSKVFHFLCPISTTDSALLYRRHVVLE